MKASRFLIFLISLVWAEQDQKSSKKGLVISNWKNHMVGDFEPFKTVSWWYNYHTYKEIYLEAPVWCHLENGTIAENKTGCFPSDPKVEFVPMIWGEKGYGSHPGLVNDPDLAETDYVVLAYNEPNRPDQADMPALHYGPRKGIKHRFRIAPWEQANFWTKVAQLGLIKYP